MAAIPHLSGTMGGTSGFDAPGTFYFNLCSSGVGEAQIAEDRALVKWRTAGTFSRFSVAIQANAQASGSTVFRLRKNGSNGNQTVSVPFGVIGHFQDAINTDTVAAGDDITISAVPGAGSAHIVVAVIGAVFTATDGSVTVTRWVCTSGTLFQQGDAGYVGMGGITAGVQAEANVQVLCPTTGVVKHGGVNVTTNSRDGATTLRSRINGSNGTMLLTIPAGTTGWFEDLVNSDAVVAGDKAAWAVALAGTSGLIVLRNVAVDHETTNGRAPLTSGQYGTLTGGTTRYASLVGWGNTWQTTESLVQHEATVAGEIAGITCNVTANAAGGGPCVLTLRLNGVDTALTLSVPAATTGFFQVFAPTVSIPVATDLLSLKAVNGSGNLVFANIGIIWGAAAVVEPEEPTVETLSATAVRSTSATLRGRIDPNGTAIEGRFRWWICGESPPNETETAPQDMGDGGNAITYWQGLTGLTPATTYCYRAVSDYGTPELEGEIMQFTTSGEALFLDGTVSHPLTWVELYVEDPV